MTEVISSQLILLMTNLLITHPYACGSISSPLRAERALIQSASFVLRVDWKHCCFCGMRVQLLVYMVYGSVFRV